MTKQAKEITPLSYPNTIKSLKTNLGFLQNSKIVSTNGKAPHSHTWLLDTLRADVRHKKIKKFRHDFGVDSLWSESPYVYSFSEYAIKTGDVTTTRTTGQVAFTTANSGYVFVKSAMKLISSSSYYEIDVNSITNAEIGIGLGTNETSFMLGRYNTNAETAYIKRTVGTTDSGTYIAITAPFTLIMQVSGTIATLAIKKDGVIHKLAEHFYDSVATANHYDGRRLTFDINLIDATSEVTITGLEGGVTSGMSPVSDLGLVQYENGEPVIYDGYYYFTSSVHTASSIGGAGGVNVFRFKKGSTEIEFIGHITGLVGTRIVCMNAGKLVYDRRNEYWYFQGTSFYSNPSLGSYITKTKSNLLFGNTIVDMTLMSLPVTAGQNAWDFSFYYDSDNDKCECVFTHAPSAVVVKCETGTGEDAVFDGTYTLTATSLISGEGSAIVYMNNTKYVLLTKAGGLYVLAYSDLAELGTITPAKWPNKSGVTPNPWGFILPIQNDATTKYQLWVFSGSDKWGGNNYGYGSLWVYSSADIEDGTQFEEKNVFRFK